MHECSPGSAYGSLRTPPFWDPLRVAPFWDPLHECSPGSAYGSLRTPPFWVPTNIISESYHSIAGSYMHSHLSRWHRVGFSIPECLDLVATRVVSTRLRKPRNTPSFWSANADPPFANDRAGARKTSRRCRPWFRFRRTKPAGVARSTRPVVDHETGARRSSAGARRSRA